MRSHSFCWQTCGYNETGMGTAFGCWPELNGERSATPHWAEQCVADNGGGFMLVFWSSHGRQTVRVLQGIQRRPDSGEFG